MDDALKVYRRAHDFFRWEEEEEHPLDQPEVIGYLDALEALKKRVFRVVPVGEDRLVEVISREKWPGFRRQFPRAADEVWGYREDWEKQLQALRKEGMDIFRERFGEAPFSGESVDVLVEKGLRVKLSDMEEGYSLTIIPANYEINLDLRMGAEERRFLLARSLVGLYYRLNDWEVMIPGLGALHSKAGLLPTPLERKLRHIAGYALKEHPNLLDRWI